MEAIKLSIHCGTLLLEKNYDEAESVGLKALELNPDAFRAHYSLGMVNLHKLKLEASEHYLRKALALRSTSQKALWNLFVVLALRRARDGDGTLDA